jgi:hypothetical protein
MATTISSPSSVSPSAFNAANAFASDGTNTSFFGGAYSDTTYSGFSSLSIPSGATIDGIEVIIEAGSNASTLETFVNNGSSNSSNKAANSLPGKTVTTVDPAWGGSSDLWGLSWTPTTAAAITLTFDWSTLTGRQVIVFDHIQIRITYTEASGYGHDVNSVGSSSIGKINSVATADIGKVNSVD